MNAEDLGHDGRAARQPARAGFLETLDASVPALCRYAGILRDDQHEADSLVHACLSTALDRRLARRDDADPRVWLFAIMHNLAMSRSRGGGVCGLFSRFGKSADGWRQGLGEPVDSIGALMRLPLEQRSVMFLVSIEELSYAAVAAVHGIPVDAVIPLLADARDRLRQIIGGGAPGTPREATWRRQSG